MKLAAVLVLAAALSCAQEEVNRIGPGVTPPRLVQKTEPKYPEEARKAAVNATVVLSLVVGVSGAPENLRVVRGAGFGLDESAIETVREWRFEPGRKENAPVRVQSQVEVHFRLLNHEHDGQRARLTFSGQPGATRPELVKGKMPANSQVLKHGKLIGLGGDTARIQFTVGARGDVQNPRLLDASNPKWGETVIRAVKGWRFRPASIGGKAVPAEGVFEIAEGAVVTVVPRRERVAAE